MMTKRIHIWLVASVWLLVCCASVFAQGTNTPPTSDPGGFPVGKDAAWLTLIPPLAATITWLIGKIPPLPKVVLPWLTPVAGLAIGAVLRWGAGANLPWWSVAGAGAIATTLYEGIKGISGAGPDSLLTPTDKPSK
jgi:hypothetical protein